MKRLSVVLLAAAALAGCAVVPASTARKSCDLLQIASDEADLAPAWYLEAGVLLEQCGHRDARAAARFKACAADRRNGADRDCEALE